MLDVLIINVIVYFYLVNIYKYFLLLTVKVLKR
jgi:hypothetical protein